METRDNVLSENAIFHEKQSWELCALHALNNLFQGVAFDKTYMDNVCTRLTPSTFNNPHRSWFGMGNYDVNVMMTALHDKDCAAVWFDSRRDPHCLDLDNVIGFILNIPSQPSFGFIKLPIQRRHWIAIREIGGAYYNLDSKLDSPSIIGNSADVLLYLRKCILEGNNQIFVVISEVVQKEQTWLHPPYRDNIT